MNKTLGYLVLLVFLGSCNIMTTGNSQAWRNDSLGCHRTNDDFYNIYNMRLRMLWDTSSVMQIFGKPNGLCSGSEDISYTYNYGRNCQMDSLIVTDNCYIVIRFDKAGKVRGTSIMCE